MKYLKMCAICFSPLCKVLMVDCLLELIFNKPTSCKRSPLVILAITDGVSIVFNILKA